MEWNDITSLLVWGKQTYTVNWNDLEKQLASFKKTNDLNLDPDFQRNHVWTKAQQVKYVEYILKGGHMSQDIVFNCPGWMGGVAGQMVLLDGKQRLEAVRLFMSNALPVFGNAYWNDFTSNGKPMPNLPHRARFTFHINDLETRAEILQLYLDMNAGGVVHSDDELNKVRTLLAIELSLSNSN